MANSRYYDFEITINKNAESYPYIKEILASETNAKYVYIYHDKDIDTETHSHVIIHYKSARKFETMQNKFKGAHIKQIISDIPHATKYLLHIGKKEKYQYSKEELFTNNREWLERNLTIEEEKHFKEPSEENIIQDIELSAQEILLLYGVKNFKLVWSIIKELKYSIKEDERITQQLAIISANEQIDNLKNLYNNVKSELNLLKSLNDDKLFK